MAITRLVKKNPICEKHKTPVVITIPANEFGNAHGERWFCEECKGSPEEIQYQL